jgi:hypothetical protein
MVMTRGQTFPTVPKHINRFGKYTLNPDREKPGPDFALRGRSTAERARAIASL